MCLVDCHSLACRLPTWAVCNSISMRDIGEKLFFASEDLKTDVGADPTTGTTRTRASGGEQNSGRGGLQRYELGARAGRLHERRQAAHARRSEESRKGDFRRIAPRADAHDLVQRRQLRRIEK